MKLKGSLACLLLFLLLGRGEASPLQGGEEDSGGEVGEAIGHGVGEAFGHVVGEAAIHGLEKARDPHLGDALAHKLKEASHALENSGSEAGRQAENIIGHGVDPAHSSGQGTPGSNGAWGTNGQPSSGGHGTPGSQGSSGGPGDTRDHVFSGGSGGSFGANAQGGPWGQGGHRGPFNLGANSQGAAAQPGSVRGSNRNTECTNPPGPGGSSGNSGGGSNGGSSGSSGSGWDTRNSDHGGSSQEYNPNSSSGSRVGSGGGNKPECDNTHVSGGSGGQGQGSSGEGEAVSGINTLNSQTSSEPFNFDTFWKNFKSKLGFINWDAINKGQAPPPSTRALLYFRRLWEDFKHNTPFLNWKVITEGEDVPSLQKRAGGAGQNYNYNQQGPPTALGGQYPAKTPSKGGVTVSSSASRTHPGLLQWVKFW
uniref:Dermokine n=1 Tax=Moschus moschiferus TaxID=68415 RepID=A0A8C6FGE6_MOSMO